MRNRRADRDRAVFHPALARRAQRLGPQAGRARERLTATPRDGHTSDHRPGAAPVRDRFAVDHR